MLYSAGLAAYHSGVEWGFWEGPASCAPTVGVGNVEDMLDQLETTIRRAAPTPPGASSACPSPAGIFLLGAAFLAALAVHAHAASLAHNAG